MRRIVIVGGGFAGLNAAKKLCDRRRFEVTLVDKENHHVFQPLLYQVATAALSAEDIATPLRHVLGRCRNLHVVQARARRVDLERRCVVTDAGEYQYDALLLACGVQNAYFGHPTWEEHAPGLKNLAQAEEIRARLLGAFERAERSTDPREQIRALACVIVGGGPTGVELAGAIAEIARHTLANEFRHIDPRRTRIQLIEAGPRLLADFAPRLSERTRRDLERLGVEVRLNTRVREVGPDRLECEDGSTIEATVILWAAGVYGVPIAATLGVPLDDMGRVFVAEDCTIPGHPEVFVAGDLAHFVDRGEVLGLVANVAAQQGRYFARTVRGDLDGRSRKPFHYFDKGRMATIGRGRAICEVGPVRFGGFPAWLIWLGIHIFYLVGLRNRLFVFMQWAWAYLFHRRGARVVVNPQWRTKAAEPAPDSAAVDRKA
ncbi:MAG TPA: NAD(P)/FAD-dependent oxidoreductase [Steroidobacteraceae bacterium]|nr:NAD(P)/FAD-dependent oxidoreductase [Steroidobacteraceae bacterium]